MIHIRLLLDIEEDIAWSASEPIARIMFSGFRSLGRTLAIRLAYNIGPRLGAIQAQSVGKIAWNPA